MKLWMTGLVLFSSIVNAQPMSVAQDSPPNEPPYVTVEEQLPAASSEEAVVPAEPRSAPSEQSARSSDARSLEADDRPVIQQTPQGRQFIKHPLSKKGLVLIDKDGSYHYATQKQTRREQTFMIRMGAIDPGPDIASSDGETNYASMYGSGSPFTLYVDYEWKPFKAFGELGVQAGFGLFTAQGNGRFVEPLPDGSREAREKYTFYALPVSLGGIYRFQYTDNQWVAPYVSGGLMYFALAELRDDNSAPNFVGTPTGYGAAGLMFNLSAIDKQAGFTLDAEYGIHTLWLSLEGRRIQASSEDLNMTGNYFSLGFGADY